MNLAATLKYLYPNIVIGEQGQSECTIELRDGVPYIEQWLREDKPPTVDEIKKAWVIVQAELESKEQAQKVVEQQQQVGALEAKRAYIRLQTIIDGVDTATVVQMRAAIKQIAIDVQHLIRAVVK